MSTAGATGPLIFVAGDTGGHLEVTVRRRGLPVDLTDTAVTATVDRGAAGEPLLDRALVVTDPTAGIARLVWQAGDLLAVADDDNPVEYHAEVTVAGETQPVPLSFLVRPRLA